MRLYFSEHHGSDSASGLHERIDTFAGTRDIGASDYLFKAIVIPGR